MSAWRITYCGPDPAKNMTWKVVAVTGSRVERNLRAVHVANLTPERAQSITPEQCAEHWMKGSLS
jgi:hypothetical protein